MGMPSGIGIVDTMIGFPQEGFGLYDFIRKQTKDRASKEEMEFPVEYIFKDKTVPEMPITLNRSSCKILAMSSTSATASSGLSRGVKADRPTPGRLGAMIRRPQAEFRDPPTS